MTKAHQKKPDLRAAINELMMADAGLGVSTNIEDRAFWLDDVDQQGDWYEALQNLDTTGDKGPLLRLLRAKAPPESVCLHLADLLERHDLVQRNTTGPKPVPSYDRSQKMSVLEAAILDVRSRPRGKRIAQAIDEAAERKRISSQTLWAALEGKHGGLNRARRGHPPKLAKLKNPAR
jgi:hypothetical protein